jgi:hypothetical protein
VFLSASEFRGNMQIRSDGARAEVDARRETARNFSHSDRRCFTRFRTFSFTIARRCQIADALVIQSRAVGGTVRDK